MNILTTILATGIPGFLSYIYLSKLGLITHTKDDKDEKVIVIAILSSLNMFASYYVYRTISGIDPFKDLTWKIAPALLFIASIVTFLLTRLVYPLAIKIAMKNIENFQKKNKIALRTNKTVYERLLIKGSGLIPFIYIFDFENNFIESGYFQMLDDSDGKITINLVNNTFHIKDTFEIEEILRDFNLEEDSTKKDLIMDLDRKLKIFIFYLEN